MGVAFIPLSFKLTETSTAIRSGAQFFERTKEIEVRVMVRVWRVGAEGGAVGECGGWVRWV